MEKLIKTSVLVKKILEELPEARNNDMLLYYRVCEARNRTCLGMPFGMVLVNLKEFKLPSFKSVERARRKVQEKHPELAARKDIKDVRKEEENKYINYARSVND